MSSTNLKRLIQQAVKMVLWNENRAKYGAEAKIATLINEGSGGWITVKVDIEPSMESGTVQQVAESGTLYGPRYYFRCGVTVDELQKGR